MMQLLAAIVLLTAAYPLTIAWICNRFTTLRYALFWAAATWSIWMVVAACGAIWPIWEGYFAQYLALCLTGCIGVAVLGARRPGAGAWNFVVMGLLAVLLLPVAEGFGTPRLNWVYLAFLGATLFVGLVNYLPTARVLAALSLAVACGIEIAGLVRTDVPAWLTSLGHCLVGLSPWLALAVNWWKGTLATEFDRTWLSFRDRYGVVWAQRTREQFNRTAANARWPVTLTWQGLQSAGDGSAPDSEDLLQTLRALLKRFALTDG
jgi:hypothetical protein